MKQFVLIGHGNMGAALLSRWQDTGVLNDARVHIVKRGSTFPATADVVVLAVKPQQLTTVLETCKKAFDAKPLYISVAAGVKAASIAKALGAGARVIRAMPNTPAKIGCGVTGLLASKGVSEAEKVYAETLFEAVGSAFWVKSDAQMNDVTAFTGSGPAYVFAMMEALQTAATSLGFSKKQAQRLVVELFMGASQLAVASKEDVGALRQAVTSKGGTTEAGLAVLKKAGLERACTSVLKSAKKRAETLAR